MIGDRKPAGAARGTGSRAVQSLSYLHARALFGAFVSLRVRGFENVPRQEAFVLAANHISPFDPFLLTLALRRWVDWVAMIELYRRPLLARYWRALAAIPVDRAKPSRQVAATVLARLSAGRVVGIFPEGGIRGGRESVLAGARIKDGACRWAIAAGVPLLPVLITGSERMTSVDGWLWPRRAFKVEVEVGVPIWPVAGESGTGKIAVEKLKIRLLAAWCGKEASTDPEMSGNIGL